MPSTAGTFTATIPANSGTVVTTGSTAAVTPAMLTQPLTLGTAQNSTSGTFVDFTGIPSWVKRVTVMFNGVSMNTGNNMLVQIGSGSFATSGYSSYGMATGVSGLNGGGYTTGFGIRTARAAGSFSGMMTIANISGNNWVQQHSLGDGANSDGFFGAGVVSLSGALDRIRLTSFFGTDTFDAGSINVMWEG